MIRCLRLALLFVPLVAAAPTPDVSRYRVILENASVRVYSLELPPHFHAPSFQNAHDVVWVALNDGHVSFLQREKGTATIAFRSGDARLFRSFATERVVNEDSTVFRAVVVELKSRGSLACSCGGPAENAFCGCAQAAHLPELWAVGLGNVTVSGTTLPPGEGFAGSAERDDSLLIAITPVELRDQGDAPQSLRLQSGEAAWLNAGVHRLQNVGTGKARFITVEF